MEDFSVSSKNTTSLDRETRSLFFLFSLKGMLHMTFFYHQVPVRKKAIDYILGRNQTFFQCLKPFYNIPTGRHSNLQSWKCSKGSGKEWGWRTEVRKCQVFPLCSLQYATSLEIYINPWSSEICITFLTRVLG